MSGRPQRASLVALGLALVLGLGSFEAMAAAPIDPELELERAARCLRRADLPCAERHAALVTALGDHAPAELRREALAIATAAIARSGQPGDEARARDMCLELLKIWPSYAPPPDADPTHRNACDAARRQALESRLPKTIDPGPAPLAEPSELLPDPVIYRPARLDHLPPKEKRFTMSLGAGLALPIGSAADRFEPGIQAVLDFRYALTDRLSLWVSGALALLRLSSDLPVEPHQGTSLTAFMATIGVELAFPVADDVELVTALGLGPGAFGLKGPDDAMGLAIAPVFGARYLAADNLSVRLDFAPNLIVPMNGIAVGGHLAFVLRGEARF